MYTSSDRAEIRKDALRNGLATAGWSDRDFENHALTMNKKALRPAPKAEPMVTAAEVAEAITKGPFKSSVTPAVEEAITAANPLTPEPAGKVEAAIADLIGAMDLKTSNDLDEGRVVELIKEHSNAPVLTSVEIKQVDKPTITRDCVHKMYPEVMSYIGAGENIATVGPAGSGKSTIFQHAAEDLGLDYYFTGAVQQEHKIMGHTDAHGVYHRTPFRDAFENGGLHVFEECDGSHARAMLSANNAVAGEYCDFPDGMIKKHENFVCVMAMNTYGTGASREYVGRNQLDAATLDRFAFLEIGYDEALEMAVATSVNADAAGWVSTVQSFRKKVARAGIRHVVSPRASIKGANLLKHGVSVDSITKSLLHKGLSADQIAQVS